MQNILKWVETAFLINSEKKFLSPPRQLFLRLVIQIFLHFTANIMHINNKFIPNELFLLQEYVLDLIFTPISQSNRQKRIYDNSKYMFRYAERSEDIFPVIIIYNTFSTSEKQ